MSSALSAAEEKEYRQALAVVQKYFAYVLQKRNPESGEWSVFGEEIRGLSQARAAMEEFKKKYKGNPHDLRVIPKAFADFISEERNIRRKMERPRRSRRPLVVLPENL